MELRISTKMGRDAGQSVVELALMLPFLLVLALGVYDVSRAIRAKNAIVNMSREGANLALRTARSSISAQEIMNSLAATAQPLAMDQNGMMYVTEVNLTGGVRISNQEAWRGNQSGPCSQINQSNVAGVVATVPVAEGTSVYVFEVIYTYQSLFLTSFTTQLHSTTAFSPYQ
ncbi:MAG: hypothetical protein A2075_18140 [Geobacteraceae bacterium GWC2_58_44]|nr:MAG: hypothetical protein A2075_18140 [Geobacteraceae bacterium GWC2_58_44]HBG04367.1 pilus assembly protein TadE [Geobacter sp.]